jgi:hypothetical protein
VNNLLISPVFESHNRKAQVKSTRIRLKIATGKRPHLCSCVAKTAEKSETEGMIKSQHETFDIAWMDWTGTDHHHISTVGHMSSQTNK